MRLTPSLPILLTGVLPLVIVVACAGRQVRRSDSDRASVARVAPIQERRPTIGGFVLGAPFLREVQRCERVGRFEPDTGMRSGTCSRAIESVGYAVHSVFLRRCGNDVCQITVRVRVDGETQLTDALDDVVRTWDARFGTEGHPPTQHDTDEECLREIQARRFSCLLRGEGRFVETWTIRRPFMVPLGTVAQLTAFGAAAPQASMIRLTLATPEGVEHANERDL